MKQSKFIWSVIVLLLLNGLAAHAQSKLPPRRAVPKPRVAATGEGMKDGVTMQKGRIILTELGISNPLLADKTLINGTTISTTGLVTAKDGTTTQINEGDHVSLSGRLTTRRAMAEADSIAKITSYDALHPGKRKKMEEAQAKKDKIKAKLEEQKIKAKEKAAKRKK
jgi:hypothetical protein